MEVNRLDLQNYRKILVTGPQRSGTTIASQMFASDLDYSWVNEKQIGVRSLRDLAKRLLNREKVVIQCPCFFPIVHHLDFRSTVVVVMRRPVPEITASEMRIGWKEHRRELRNYFRDSGVLAEVRYQAWDTFQKPFMRVPWVEIKYSSLCSHPLWLPPDLRHKFSAHQTQP